MYWQKCLYGHVFSFLSTPGISYFWFEVVDVTVVVAFLGICLIVFILPISICDLWQRL